ncbi:Leucine-rich repeat containing protein [Entamoeba marina]
MSILEKVYLANVVMYLKTIQTAVKFIRINKKCKDALEILRCNPGYSSENIEYSIDHIEMLDVEKGFFVELSLFPNIETIRLNTYEFSFQILSRLPSHFKKIEIANQISLINSSYVNELLLYKDYITSMELSYLHDPIDLTQFHQLRRVKVSFSYSCQLNYENLFGFKKHLFNYVYLTLIPKMSLNFFKELDQYNFKQLIVNCNNNEDVTNELLQIENIQNRIIILHKCVGYNQQNKQFLYSSFEFDDYNSLDYDLLNKYFPCKIKTNFGDGDDFVSLEKLNSLCHCDMCGKAKYILPTTVTRLKTNSNCLNIEKLQLKELHLLKDNDYFIPTSVTKLIVEEKSKINFGTPCNVVDLTFFNNTPSFRQWNCLTSLTLSQCDICNSFSTITSLKTMSVHSCNIRTSIDELYPLSLTILKIDYTLLPKKLNVQSLSILTFPTSLSKLTVGIVSRINESNLSDINLNSFVVFTHIPFNVKIVNSNTPKCLS